MDIHQHDVGSERGHLGQRLFSAAPDADALAIRRALDDAAQACARGRRCLRRWRQWSWGAAKLPRRGFTPQILAGGQCFASGKEKRTRVPVAPLSMRQAPSSAAMRSRILRRPSLIRSASWGSRVRCPRPQFPACRHRRSGAARPRSRRSVSQRCSPPRERRRTDRGARRRRAARRADCAECRAAARCPRLPEIRRCRPRDSRPGTRACRAAD